MDVYVSLQKNNVIAASIIHAAADERIREVLTQMFGKTKRGDFMFYLRKLSLKDDSYRALLDEVEQMRMEFMKELLIQKGMQQTDLLFKPSKIGTSIVAFLLALAAWFVLQLGGVAPIQFFHFFYFYGAGLLSCLFILRSIGDFKWVGFFKRKKGTVFAKCDTVLYSPLCFLLGTAILMIMLLRTA
ncbi:DUF3995 domain-containing protein [Paenibacillus sp. ALE1]|uniref:DUF3995 domain-containing protein n=1 Tax=unclassified Paenibacillus TaxID=185978 RepID=UPI001EEAEA37|nr:MULTISPECIES: DUF3995 domain-containing protein [unclassified Paenibacillus]